MVLNVDSIGINYDGAIGGAIADCSVYKKLKINDGLYFLKITVYIEKIQ